MNRDNNSSEENRINTRYIYGPVPSRRLGVSLGVDIVPCKLCSFDCVYCQLGKTTRLASRRQHTVRMKQFSLEAAEAAQRVRSLDCVSFAGSGEPTVSLDLADCCAVIKNYFTQPLVLITNASLFWRPSVVKDIQGMDIIIPSLDAVSPAVFKAVNKPAAGIEIAKIVRGLVALRQKYSRKIYLEVMLVKGLNDTVSEMRKVAVVAQRIQPEKVQLNLPTRVPSGKNMMPDARRVEEIESIFREYVACVEIVGKFTGAGNVAKGSRAHAMDQLVTMLKRRPATIKEMVSVAGLDEAAVRLILRDIASAYTLRCAKGYYSIT